MIEKLDPKDFDTVFSIMERSFPREEYRPCEVQKALLSDPAYGIYVARENGQILGFAAVWELEDMLFLEHLAVEPGCRSGGIGSRLLQYFANWPACLEVEPPETDICRRRIGFYERNGFFLNPYAYAQPSLGEGRKAVPLKLMTTGAPLTPEAFRSLKGKLYTQVYGLPLQSLTREE